MDDSFDSLSGFCFVLMFMEIVRNAVSEQSSDMESM